MAIASELRVVHFPEDRFLEGPRVNELTYPSFDVDDPKDTRRLLQGYTEARRAGRFARPGSEVLDELRRAIEVH